MSEFNVGLLILLVLLGIGVVALTEWVQRLQDRIEELEKGNDET